MSRMTLRDKVRDCQCRGEILPMKGHLRLELEDIRDGKKIVTESDNLVTKAVQSIFDHNYSGLARYDALLPLKSLYSGVFAFQNQQTENADNWQLESDLVNPLVAHAGDQANNTGSTLRGSPVSNEWIESDNSISMSWLWDNTQGNGHIESCSLVPSVLGNMGTKPFDDEFNPLSVFGYDSDSNASFNEEINKKYPFNISDDGKISWSLWIDGNTFKEYTIRHDYFAFGIMRGVDDWQEVAVRTATIRSGANRFIFDDDDYYYIARATSATAMQIDKVNKTTFAVTQADCTFSGMSLWTGNIEGGKNVAMRIFGYDGTYLYYPNSTRTQFLKLNISDTVDSIVLDGELTIENGQISATTNGWQFMSPLAINTGLVLGSNYLINGTKTYPISHVKGIGGASTYLGYAHWLWLVRKGASVYGHAKQTYGTSSSQWSGQSNVLCQMFKSSVVNLAEARDKSTSQTMRIVYTLTEQTS